MVRYIFLHVDFNIPFFVNLDPLWLWMLEAGMRHLDRVEQGFLKTDIHQLFSFKCNETLTLDGGLSQFQALLTNV